MERPEWIVVGHVVRAHGLRGEVRVQSESDNPDRFAPGEVIFCRLERSAGAARPRDAAGGAPDSGAGGAAAGGRPPVPMGRRGPSRPREPPRVRPADGRRHRSRPAAAGSSASRMCVSPPAPCWWLLPAWRTGRRPRSSAAACWRCPPRACRSWRRTSTTPLNCGACACSMKRGGGGTVLELLDTPAQPVLSLRRAAGGEVLVPFTLEAVPTVDVPGGRLVVLRRFILE